LKRFAKRTGGWIKLERILLPSIYTSFCVRRSSFWVKTQASGEAIFVLSKYN